MQAVEHGRILAIYSAKDTHNICVAIMQQSLWIVNAQPAPPGTFGGNSAYNWNFYNNSAGLIKPPQVKNAPTIKPFNGGHEFESIEGSSQAYSFSASKPIHLPKLACHSVHSVRCREMEFACWVGTAPRSWPRTSAALGSGAALTGFHESSTWRAHVPIGQALAD